MTHPPPHGGAQTSLQAMSPAGHSCDSAIPVCLGSPVPHPNAIDSWSSPQQMRGSGLIPGKPRNHWTASAKCSPLTLGRGSREERISVMRAYAYVSIPAPHTPCHALNQSQADAIQLCLHGGGLVHMCRVGPPTVTAQLSGIHPFLPTPPLVAPSSP